MSSSEMSSPAASVAGTPSPEPSTPPTSPAKSTPPSSPSKRQTAAAAKKEETRKAKEIEKAKKWRGSQRGKVEKVIEKKGPGVKAILEKLSTAWDVVGLAEYQIRLLDDEEVSNGPELEQRTKDYEEGPQMIKDFIGWIKAEYSPEDIVIEEKTAGDDGDKMEVDELEQAAGTKNGDVVDEKAGEQADNGENQDDDVDDDEEEDEDE